MFLQNLWRALPFVQWEDAFSFHARLFRCFLLSSLDAHSDLAFVSQGSDRILTVVRQRLADMGTVSHQFGRHNNAIMRCPPKRRYDTTSLPSFVATSQENQLMAVPLAFVPQLVNVTDGFYEGPKYSAVASDLPGSDRVLLGGYDASFTTVVGCILLWLLALAIVIWRFSRMVRARSTPIRPTVAAEANLGKRVTRPLLQDHLSIENGTRSPIADIAEDVDHRLTMPGAWLHECRKQNAFDTHPEPVSGVLWSLIYFCPQKAWARFLGMALTLATPGPSDCDSNDVVAVRRTLNDGSSLVRQGPGPNEVDRVADITMHAVIDGIVVNCLSSEYDLSIRNRRGSDTEMCDRCEPASIGDPVIKDQVRTTILDAVHEEKIGLVLSQVTSTRADRVSCQGDISSDCDESANGDRTEGTDNEDSFGFGTQRSGILPLERKVEYRAVGRLQDGTLSDTGCPLSLRRAQSMGYLRRKHDIFNDGDDAAGNDSYWTEQVNARLSGARPYRYGSSDVSLWPREGREDETDNWRTRNPQATHSTTPEKASDVHPTSDNRLRQYSSPPLSVNVSLSDRAGSDDGPRGIYIVPQKRGRTVGDHCWSPVSSPRPTDRPSGLGFLPFRQTPSLLTPEAWRPGCLYIPDPPADETSRADVWWDSLSSVGGCGAGHVSDGGAVVPGAPAAGRSHGAQVSWRDRYENDPASRRFSAVHRRAMTEG